MKNAETPNAAQDVEQVLSRALVAAHLITGNLEYAEQAVVKAVEHWNPGEASEDDFLSDVLHEATRIETSPEPHESIADLYLADELKAVMRLDARLRSCFVLRNLVGLSSRVCARFLRLLPDEIDERNACALRRLALS